MYPYNPKRKKIRGWKRRVRQVERWGEWIRQPDLIDQQQKFRYDLSLLSLAGIGRAVGELYQR